MTAELDHWREMCSRMEREREQMRRQLQAAPRHQDDCDRVQDISGRARCNCAEIGRALRAQVRQQQQRIKELEKRLSDAHAAMDALAEVALRPRMPR